MPAPYHACIIRPIGDFQQNSIVTQQRDHQGKPYNVLLGRLKGQKTLSEHSYHYEPKDWTESAARSHCRSHKGQSFEPAAPDNKKAQDCDHCDPHEGRAYQAILGQPWAILPATLQEIIAIASRTPNESIDALEARLGRPLDNTRSVVMRDGVAVIPVTGPIVRYAGMFSRISGATSTETLARDFTMAMESKEVRSILLNIDSPGGAANGINELAAMIRSARDTGDKSIHAYVGGHGASAAYWLASAAERITVDPSALVGSIGVVAAYTDDAGLQEKTGIKRIEIVSSGAARKRPDLTTDEGKAQIQAMVDALEQVFVGAVADNRGLSRDQVLAHEGGILVGQQAIDGGLADALGSFEAAISDLSARERATARKRTSIGAKVMSEELMTAERLRADHADVYDEVFAAGETHAREAMKESLSVAKTEGAKAERERIQSVLDQSMPGHEDLVRGLAFDGKTTGPEAAMAVLKAEKESRAKGLADFRADGIKPVPVKGNVMDLGRETPTDAESIIAGYVSQGKSRATAIRLLASEHPEAHRAWIDRANSKRSA